MIELFLTILGNMIGILLAFIGGMVWRELRLLRLGIHASPENWLAQFKRKPRKL